MEDIDQRYTWTAVLAANPNWPSSPRLILRKVPAPALSCCSSPGSTPRSPPHTPPASLPSSPSSSPSSSSSSSDLITCSSRRSSPTSFRLSPDSPRSPTFSSFTFPYGSFSPGSSPSSSSSSSSSSNSSSSSSSSSCSSSCSSSSSSSSTSSSSCSSSNSSSSSSTSSSPCSSSSFSSNSSCSPPRFSPSSPPGSPPSRGPADECWTCVVFDDQNKIILRKLPIASSPDSPEEPSKFCSWSHPTSPQTPIKPRLMTAGPEPKWVRNLRALIRVRDRQRGGRGALTFDDSRTQMNRRPQRTPIL
ncbi:putative protein TPRXL [Siniperca chuatsi]|uniref:putative protein TPRXL n=1 Tax=Siniperca chuatsi TaxID=119488 RepID=UPI001CE191E8|nr:putative protein TPRXL [Siniperca chuatsi]XP_044056723.1 putative protein TPRXL [Siniperca chuatsi]XP_044056724.1 putative protein TPRXL [Siniperca chuatsi]XP_044056725.1 putative protein TPRXL [Siniperca chuatsi]XP_044056726.1 putative protein TPRXL [Siniperca chuatsi]XP_044056727.1 putative protein TPRXL [Siniperca chuatsi]XP_044056728.1 putative protein TPRXL [Siniperca chuatsi]XP_044056729.1 putative protein TPRXL [Siniperca chuatsi]XP_044056730.1 putative protein TPRXL [Siniperca ch